MGRKLATFALMAAVGVSSSASAIGLGKIETDSALNEPLSARIPLFSVSDSGMRNVKAELASPDAFDRAGVDRPFYLSRLKFRVKKGQDGRPTIEVTTENPIKEPFLDFLVEIRWPQGRMLREYTVLLDPPLYTDDTPTGTASAPAGGASSSDSESTAASQPAAPTPPVAASGPARSGKAGSGAASASTDDSSGPSTYGPVGADDTLYSIANEVRPQSVTANQAMIALLRTNPDAFLGNNINRLKRGAVLRVPDRDAMASVSTSEATRRVREQMASWRSSRGTEVASAEASKSSGAESAAGKPDATAGGSKPEETTASAEGHLTVVAPEDASGQRSTASLADAKLDATDKNIETLQKRMGTLEETNASLESENKDLKQQLESMKADLVRLKAMVNVQMEEPVAGAAGASSEMANGPSEPASTEPKTTGSNSSASDKGTGTADNGGVVTAKAPGEESSAEPVAAEQTAAGEAGSQTPSMSQAKSESAPKAAETKPAKTEPTAPPPTLLERVESVFQRLLADPQLLAEVGGGAILLLILLMLILRRRRAPGDGEQELGAIIADPSGGQTAQPDVDATGSQEDETSANPQEDPLEQAELLVAYGNLAKAQDVLDDALGEDPDNKTLRAKLMEVLAAREDRGGFEAEAQVLHTQVDSDSDPVWQRTVELGRRIAPEHPLFTAEDEDGGAPDPVADAYREPAAGAVAERSETASNDDDLFAFDLDDDEQAREVPDTDDSRVDDAVATPGAETGLSDSGDEDDLSFDFALTDESDPVEDLAADGDGSRIGRTDDTEFDLSSEESELDRGLEFSLDNFPQQPAAPANAADEDGDDEDDLGGLDFELPDDLQPGSDASETGTGAESDTDDDFSLDFGDFSFESDDLEGNAADSAESEGAGTDQEDLETLDETGTKLDLARAYLDMGDHDGAKGLLEEVIEEGSGGQQQEARALLKRTG